MATWNEIVKSYTEGEDLKWTQQEENALLIDLNTRGGRVQRVVLINYGQHVTLLSYISKRSSISLDKAFDELEKHFVEGRYGASVFEGYFCLKHSLLLEHLNPMELTFASFAIAEQADELEEIIFSGGDAN
jgi:hypothetical protein